MSGRYAVICNPASAGGRGKKRLPLAVTELERLGAEFHVVETRDIEHAREAARAAVAARETVIAIGGDGLLRPVAAELRGSESALAIVPGGRGNDLARVLEIPTDTAEATRIAVEGREWAMDMAVINGEPYLGIASFGFDSDANRIANEARLLRGDLVYLYAAIRALIAWKPARFTLTVDGERHEVTGFSAGVPNSRAYGGGMFVAPQAELDDGLLDVVALGEVSKLYFLFRLMPKIFKGVHLSDPAFHYWRGSSIELAASRDFTIYADGDPIAELPARVEVEPRCLRVIVPA